MSEAKPWLLPEGFSDALPDEAWRLESTRQRMLEQLRVAGYDYVQPPTVEFLDSLLTGTGEHLGLDTIKVNDRKSGRTMGVRADFTPQISRIDTHYLNEDGIVRLCYAGACLRAHSGALGSREPMVVGAELFGDTSLDADIEVVELIADCLLKLGINEFDLSIGHVGLLDRIASQHEIEVTGELLGVLHRKDRDGLAKITQKESNAFADFDALMRLIGGREVIDRARKRFGSIGGVNAILDDVERLASTIATRYPTLALHFEFSEARGYAYHNGIVFNALHAESLIELGRGGRYDNVGALFGRQRAATGFSLDLRRVVRVLRRMSISGFERDRGVILAPNDNDPALHALIESERDAGRRVVRDLGGSLPTSLVDVRATIQLIKGEWRVVDRDS